MASAEIPCTTTTTKTTSSSPNREGVASKGRIPDHQRTTHNYMTKYERARILGTRSSQIARGSPIMVELAGETDPLVIATKELLRRTIPLQIERYFPDGSFESWSVSEMIIE